MEEVGDIALVILDEFFLASAGVYDETDTEGELLGAGEETDGLGDAVLDDREVLHGEVVYQTA